MEDLDEKIAMLIIQREIERSEMRRFKRKVMEKIDEGVARAINKEDKFEKYELSEGEIVNLRVKVKSIRDNCVVEVGLIDAGSLPEMRILVHRNHLEKIIGK